ncbi:MAG: PilZ domain-containing protein, partial [Candidatus Acidiferrum sp.]
MLELRKRNALAGVTPMGRDRRICPRYGFTAEAEALDANSRGKMTARTSDISRGGCYVDTFCPFPRNASVMLRIVRDKECLIAQAKVVYSKLGMGMGLSFTALEPDNKRILDRWIGELSGTAPLDFNDHHHEHSVPHQHAAAQINSSVQNGASASSHPITQSDHNAPSNRTAQSKSNDPAYVLGELIIALMRRGGLSS